MAAKKKTAPRKPAKPKISSRVVWQGETLQPGDPAPTSKEFRDFVQDFPHVCEDLVDGPPKPEPEDDDGDDGEGDEGDEE